jgi:hypothetical protein
MSFGVGGLQNKIELRRYAASIGFEYDKAKSSRRSAVMSRGPDKIIIKQNAGDGHYVYFHYERGLDHRFRDAPQA